MRLRNFVLTICCLIPGALFGQVDHYPVDTTANSVLKPLPFDRPFLLDFRGKDAKSIYAGAIFEWKISGNKRTLKMKKNGKLVYQMIKADNVFETKNGADVFIRGQKPNSNLVIMLAHRFDNKLMEDLLEANLLIKNGKNADANTLLETLEKSVEDQIKPLPGIQSSQLTVASFFAFGWIADPNILVKKTVSGVQVPNISATVVKGYNQFYVSDLSHTYQNLTSLKSTVTGLDITLIRSVVAIADALKINSTAFNSLVSLRLRDQLKQVLSGEISLKDDFLPSIVKESNFPGRVENLKVTVATLEKIMQVNEGLRARSLSADLTAFYTELQSLKDDCEANLKMLKEMYENIEKQIHANSNLTYSSWATGHNEVWDLKTAGSYQVIPDIGVIGIFATGNVKNEFIVRPYIGASIYLRPVDKNVPFKYFDSKYRWQHRFSFNFGVTVGNNDEGEFSGLFNSMNLLFGANYKILRPVSISGGVSLMKRTNSNPAINAKETVANPYVALSFDVDFMNAIQKLTGNFIK